MTEQRWYVLYVRGGSEQKAKAALEELEFEVFLPMYSRMTKPRHVRGRKTPKRKQEEKPLFKNYIFANLSLDQLSKATGEREVHGVLKVNDKPATILPSVIEQIRHHCQMGVHNEMQSIQLFAGDQVILSAGPLEGFTGLVIRQPDNEHKIDVEINGLKIVAPIDFLRKLGEENR